MQSLRTDLNQESRMHPFKAWLIGVFMAVALISLGAYLNDQHGFIQSREANTQNTLDTGQLKTITSPFANPKHKGSDSEFLVEISPQQGEHFPVYQPNFLVPAVQKVAPAVVSIYTDSRNRRGFPPFMRPPENDGQRGVGSGVIFNDEKGYIVTNAHVVNNANEITVEVKDGRKFEATLIGLDEGSDIAVIAMGKHSGVVKAVFGFSDQIEVGQWTIAIGAPLGKDHSVSVGVVSAIGRQLIDPGEAWLDDLIQTDAAINPGNSGGPLCNAAGEIIGINTAIQRGGDGSLRFGPTIEGIGYAIAVDTIKDVVDQLITKGTVERPWMGVEYSMASERDRGRLKLKEEKGLLLNVRPNSPAWKAGLRTNDLIVTINGMPVDEPDMLKRTVKKTGVGGNIKLKIWRIKKHIDIEVELGIVPKRGSFNR